jgi:hypothetical protein
MLGIPVNVELTNYGNWVWCGFYFVDDSFYGVNVKLSTAITLNLCSNASVKEINT